MDPPSGTETVNVPRTWNIGKYDDYEGVAWYFRSFTFPTELAGKHVELNFGATFYRSRVWLNGAEIGGHEGGYTSYHLDISGHLQRGKLLHRHSDTFGVRTIEIRDRHLLINGQRVRLSGMNPARGLPVGRGCRNPRHHIARLRRYESIAGDA